MTLVESLGRGGSWLRRRLLEPEYPTTAVEFRARSLGVVRLERRGGRPSLGAASCLDLPEGTLSLSMAQPNVVDPEALRRTLGAALERVGALKGGRIALVLPDPVARVKMLPASEIRGRGSAEVEQMVRFRMRKEVPFDVHAAGVSHLRLSSPKGEAMALVAAIFRPVLEGYEEACHALGFYPGLVELAGLALLGAAFGDGASGDRLLVNWDDGYVSLILVRAGAPALIRTLTGDATASLEHVAREAANTVLYYRERMGGAGLAGAAIRSTALPPAEAAAALQEPLGVTPDVLDLWPSLGAGDGGAAGQALAGAAACVLGRAA